jgi:hypothetical protein
VCFRGGKAPLRHNLGAAFLISFVMVLSESGSHHRFRLVDMIGTNLLGDKTITERGA